MRHLRILLTLAALAIAACNRPAPEPDAAAQSVASAATTTPATPASEDPMALTVYKTPTCGCCGKWVDYMRDAGFRVTAIDQNDLTDVKKRLGVTNDLASCHTATVGGYVVEGHVPVEDVRRLLAERPDVVGIAAPGMPMGSPGMEGAYKDRYDVVSFDRAGKTAVFASH